MSSRQIRLFVIDPQPLIAAALHHFLAAHAAFQVVGSSQTAKPLTLRTVCPDVILLCQEHASSDVCETIGACRAAIPTAKICFMACHPHSELVVRALDAGADAFLVKDAKPAELIEAILKIFDGSTFVDPRFAASTVAVNGAPRRARALNGLSVRETEVLRLIADGYSNREISIALCLSEKTIKNHISRIFAKLHITARTQAVIHAIKTGIA